MNNQDRHALAAIAGMTLGMFGVSVVLFSIPFVELHKPNHDWYILGQFAWAIVFFVIGWRVKPLSFKQGIEAPSPQRPLTAKKQSCTIEQANNYREGPVMRKTFQYRLYPTKKQIHVLNEQLDECRWLWNTALAERKTAYEDRKRTISYYDQAMELPGMKATIRPGLKAVHSQVLQDTLKRLDKAMDAFFRRLNAGEKPGYPRFKGRGRYDSLTYPQMGQRRQSECQ